MHDEPALSLTVRVPTSWVARIKAIAARELTQPATIWRRAIRIGLEAEEARIKTGEPST